MSKIVTLYNHKGGVSKTTTTFNLAHAVNEHLGKRVLIVDGDPQCNLTELVLAPLIEGLDATTAATGEEGALPGSTVLQALGPRFHGDRADVDVDSISLVHPDADYEVYLLRGDVSLNEAEDYLSAAHSQRLGTEVHQRRNYVAINDMLRRLGEQHNIDVIFVDVGPSAGALTRSFFLACDYFLVPTAPDRFNYQAIGSLSTILKRWFEEHAPSVPDFPKFGLMPPPGRATCLGLIIQRFQRYGGAAKAGFQLWLDWIPERATRDLFPALIGAIGPEAVSPTAIDSPTVAQIPDFSSLAPMMLTFGKPIWRLTRGDTGWGGTVWEEAQVRMAEFRDLFFQLAELIDRAGS